MTTEVFEQAYQALNSRQREAVDTIDGPVMVIAGPGTGKTQILALRIAKILLSGNGTPPSAILCLTFTDAGAREMRRRLRVIIGGAAEEVRVHTYHGFAGSIIAEFPDHFPHLARSKQITEIEAETFIRDILKDKKFIKLRPAGDPDFYVGKIIQAIEQAKKEAWTPEIMRSFAQEEIERVNNNETSISSRGVSKGQLKGEALKQIEKGERTVLFADVYQEYEERKKADRKMDFNDLIIELLKALREDKLLLQIIQEKFLYLLVDEHQDTNDSQNMLIRTIADFFDSPNLFVVGDEKQAIFRFQGASVENFLRFQNLWQSMKVISLTDNYRSHQGILDASFALIENNYAPGESPDLRVKLIARSTLETGPVEVVLAGNTDAGDQYLLEQTTKIIKQEPRKTIAIIVRRNREVEHLLSLFEAGGIVAQAERGVDVFSHPVGILFFDLIEYMAHPGNIEALARSIAAGLWNLNFEQKTLLIRSIRSGNVAVLGKEIPAIKKLQKEITRDGAIAFLIEAARQSGFDQIAERNPLSAEVWRSIVVLAQDLARQNRLQSGVALIEALLAYRQSAEKKSLKITIGRPDSQVKIMTAHGSKGLEYDYVFLPYATEEVWLSKKHGSSFVFPREKGDDDDIRDARRLFYVALTRAKKRAVIISDLEDNLQKEFSPLRFITELETGSVAKVTLPAVFEGGSRGNIVNCDLLRGQEIINYAKNILTESGLSVTALNHFTECPSKFLYKSIFKLPEAPSSSSEKGNAMHEALALVFHQANKDEEAVMITMAGVIKTYFEQSLLPAFEKEPAMEELLINALPVSRALAPLLALSGRVLTETWVKTPYTGRYQTEEAIILLHGKLDLVIEDENRVLVFDYKTREAMSINAIKGETKSDSGCYFRQLIFYKLLLAGDERLKNKIIEPALVFIKPDQKGRCPIISIPIEKKDEERVKKEIGSLIDSVWSGELLTAQCGEKKCEWCALKQETL